MLQWRNWHTRQIQTLFSPGSTPGWSTIFEINSGGDFVNNISAVAIGMLIAAHREGDEEKFRAYVELIAETYEQQGNDHMHSIALANTCDLRCRDTREEQYNAIVQKYDEKTVQQFAVLTAITMTALLENPEQDFLGTVYHNLGLSKSQAGQFFTPYNVGQMMARINMPDSLVLDKSRILRVNDPCCGAGCLLLAGYNVMREQLESTDPDWDKYVLFVAQDIDPLVCKMCYIQMCCIGVPGVIVVGNSLFPDAERAPTDFWFTHKYFALDEKALENTYQKTGIYGI